ncbi:MAG: DUF6152 family protein [Bryobacteraceae bacterium]
MRTLLALFCFLLAGTPAWAHHSIAAEYDRAKPVTHRGVVTRIDWTNPHVFLYIDEKADDGEVVNWGLECYAPNVLRHAGFFKDTLKVGDYITVTGWAAKDLKQRFAGREINLTDGRTFFVGPSTQ